MTEPNDIPEFDIPVKAVIQHYHTKGQQTVTLTAVDADDYTWVISECGSELSYDWNVIDWSYE